VLLAGSPLASVEDTIAVDSSGISLRTYAPTYRASKYGDTTPARYKGWIKIHVGVGPRTHVIGSVRVTKSEGDGTGDAPNFIPLVDEARANGFNVRQAVADAAYSSHMNVQYAQDHDMRVFIPFPDGKGEGKDAPESYRRLFRLFCMQGSEFFAAENYGTRQSVECAFSMLKRTIASSVRARSEVAAKNEALIIALVHNLRCLISAIHKHGIEPFVKFDMKSLGPGAVQ
jgi:transposase